MNRLKIALPVVLLTAGTLFSTPINLNKPVTLNGAFPAYVGPYGNLCGVGIQPQGIAASLDDGVFLPEGTCYQSGPVYWQNPVGTAAVVNTIDIDLQGTFTLNGTIVQADDNDIYTLQYRDTGGVYHDWWNIGTLGAFGMITRPGSPNQTTIQSLPAVQATGLRFFAPLGSGDGEYAVSEIEVFLVPEPATTWMVLSGLALALIVVSRRQRPAGN